MSTLDDVTEAIRLLEGVKATLVAAPAPAPTPVPTPTPVPVPPPPAPPPAANSAVLLFDDNNFAGATLLPGSGNNNVMQYITGGAFDKGPFTKQTGKFNLLSIVTTGTNTPEPCSNYIQGLIKDVTGPNGTPVKALSLMLKKNSPNTTVEQIRLAVDYNLGFEPVFYQETWVKFDSNTLLQAQRTGPGAYYRIFHEIKCGGNRRYRVQLRYDGTALFVESYDDVLTNANPLHPGQVKTPVDLNKWHKLEVYLDRSKGIWWAAFNGRFAIKLTGVSAPGDQTNFIMACQQYMDASMSNMVGPSETLFTGIKFWSAPPAGAFTLI